VPGRCSTFRAPPAALFNRRSLELLNRSRKSPVRGFVGGRIDLIPHPLYIAQEVANRHAPRVLLSDEVGLGKTIEACLILHRLLLSGRVCRATVPAWLSLGSKTMTALGTLSRAFGVLRYHQYSAKRFRSLPKIDCTLAKSLSFAACSASSISRSADLSIV